MADASLFDTALQLHRAGELDQAERLYRRVLDQTPNHSDAMFRLSELALRSGKRERAAGLLERAVRIDFSNAFYFSSLGAVYRSLGRHREAAGMLLMAIARKPDLADAVFELALTFEEQGDAEAAAACSEHARALDPNRASTGGKPASSGDTNPQQGDQAGMSPAELLGALAETLRLGGSAEQASIWYRMALRLNPRMPNAHTALGAIHADAGRFDEAIEYFRTALELDENFHPARGFLATALDETGRIEEAQAAYREAVARCPGDPVAHSVLLFNMPFWPGVSASDISAEAATWNARHARPLSERASPPNVDRAPERRLRIGYVSPDFQTHVQSLFTIPLLQNHDHGRFEIFCYSSADKATQESARIRGYADVFRDVLALDDAALAALIRRDRIDILVDLTMHMTGRRLLAFARRPAPIQLCWLAYPGTTGLETMDYRLSDPFLDPPNSDPSAYSEKTIQLPDTFWCYDPLTDVPEVSALPALTNGRITFGCLNHFRKLNADVLRLWATVLLTVPQSRLLLLAPAKSARDRVHALFEAAGVERARVEFVDRSGRLDYLSRYREIDICLDTFPYNGHTTSLDALWMGVPTVTLTGQTVVGRAGVSQALNLDLSELIATTPEEFVEIASGLAGHLEHLSELRRTLRERLRQSPLMDGPRFARNLEAVYRDVWRRFCEREST
ncbi:MAG TPA: tetratricopeptide repeat protein [Polyangiaceae bacterium]|nr:tetratricopeptide repeat protein [Polyangiaceae bacterium]